jgi:cysteine-rich repeat protein
MKRHVTKNRFLALPAVAFTAVLAASVLGGCTVRFGSSGEDENDGGSATCGNGTLEAGEVCDGTDLGGQSCESAVGHEQGALGCTDDCRLDLTDCSTCGDAEVEGSEECDDGNLNIEDGCSDTCEMEPGWVCSGEPSVCSYTCGNGSMDEGEGCDDGNMSSGDGCSSSCQTEPGWQCYGVPTVCTELCGDGMIVGGETCDDDNGSSGDGCSSECLVEQGWSCTGEPSICQTACGDGAVGGPEECDDGNVEPGDGCSAECEVEEGWSCTGQPSVCQTVCGDGTLGGQETCDDGNEISDDGCDASCQVEPYFACSGEPSLCTCVVYVDVDPVSGTRDGASWARAFESVQPALDQAHGLGQCEVWVAEGLYSVFTSNDQNGVSLRTGVEMYGGFQGGETSRSARDWFTHETILDGANPTQPGQGARHVLNGENVHGVVVDGFTVSGGRVYLTPSGGGGLRALDSTIDIANCIFSDNRAERGGGVYLGRCTATVTDSTFTGNSTIDPVSLTVDGGGMAIYQGNVTVHGCVFSQNNATDDGGGLDIAQVDAVVSDCVFEQNTAGDEGGGVSVIDAMPTIHRCLFHGNTATWGGGMEHDGATTAVINSIFYANEAEEGGAAMDYNNSSPTYTNCVFVQNIAYEAGGGALKAMNGTQTAVVNSIFWSNQPGPVSSQFGNIDVYYSLIDDAGPGNINGDPLLADPQTLDFTLLAGSPCIDAADGDAAPDTDRAGNPRADDPATQNTGTGALDYADIGAYEYQP